MRKYQFRLERLLEIRKYREQESELKLAAATGECVRLQTEIAEMDLARRNTLAKRYEVGGVDLAYLTAGELYMRRLDARTRSNQEELVERERDRDSAREEYLAASRDRKVLDRLKEKRETAYRKEQLKQEIFEIDDSSGSSITWKNEHR